MNRTAYILLIVVVVIAILILLNLIMLRVCESMRRYLIKTTATPRKMKLLRWVVAVEKVCKKITSILRGRRLQ